MVISRLRSHVGSSDLPGVERRRRLVDQQQVGSRGGRAGDADALSLAAGQRVGALVDMVGQPDPVEQAVGRGDRVRRVAAEEAAPEVDIAEPAGERSEEHTSELQSLMRISYAVFCLKKKK